MLDKVIKMDKQQLAQAKEEVLYQALTAIGSGADYYEYPSARTKTLATELKYNIERALQTKLELINRNIQRIALEEGRSGADSYVRTEEFLDEIVERLRKKQL